MAFSFPAASTSIIKGDNFYRIKARSIDQNSSGLETELGPGDLIPIDVGFTGIQVGPESDYENYELVFYDPLGEIQVIPFSSKRPFVGKVPTDAGTLYPEGDGEKQKAFVRIADPSTANGVFGLASGLGRIAVTVADIIVFTNATPTALPTQRVPNRRSGYSSVLPFVPLFYYIPGYGRRELTVEASRMMLLDGDSVVSISVDGMRLYQPFASNPADTITGPMIGKVLIGNTITNLLATTPLPNTTPLVVPLTETFNALSFAYNAERDGKGYFDFYRVTFTAGGTERPQDFYSGMGVHLNMEVRD